VTTLPVYLYSKVRFGLTPEVNALSTMMLGGSVALVLVAMKLHRPAVR
jgi:spermidine/putrescine transport system permease protein